MNCPECGHEVPDGGAFCGDCGARVEARPAGFVRQTKPDVQTMLSRANLHDGGARARISKRRSSDSAQQRRGQSGSGAGRSGGGAWRHATTGRVTPGRAGRSERGFPEHANRRAQHDSCCCCNPRGRTALIHAGSTNVHQSLGSSEYSKCDCQYRNDQSKKRGVVGEYSHGWSRRALSRHEPLA